MKKTRYAEEQIAFTLRQAKTDTPIGEVIRKMGIFTQTFYRWKKQYVDILPRMNAGDSMPRITHFAQSPLWVPAS
jgi:hypothetical protein